MPDDLLGKVKNIGALLAAAGVSGTGVAGVLQQSVDQCQMDRVTANKAWEGVVLRVEADKLRMSENCVDLLDTCEAARARFEAELMRRGN